MIEEPQVLIEALAKTIYHFFPNIGKWLLSISDPRCSKKITYHFPTVFWCCTFIFLFKLESSRNLNFLLGKKKLHR